MKLLAAYLNGGDWISVLSEPSLFASSANFEEVGGKLFLIAVSFGVILLAWYVARTLPENCEMPKGVTHFMLILLCAIGAWTLHGHFGLSVAWAWVAFFATAIASLVGLSSGYRLLDKKEGDLSAATAKTKPATAMLLFLASAALVILVLLGYVGFLKGMTWIFD